MTEWAVWKVIQSKEDSNDDFWAPGQLHSYNAAGAVTSMQLGNGRWESTQFNSRLQPTQIALGATNGATNLLKLDYAYGTTNNNGNILSQTITVPTAGLNTGFVAVQSYTYDSLNRINDVTENVTPTGGSSSQSWKQTFTYDRYGNRNFDEANTTTLIKNCGTSPNLTVCAADRKVLNPEILASNNRIKGDQDGDGINDYTFDASGNTTHDAQVRTFIYDAENKQVEVRDSQQNVIGQYQYDGDGKRVKKVVPATGEVTVFVYDAAGKLVAEYSTIVETANPQISYLTNDHLGSPRINTDQNGSVTARHDYHPFGEEIIGTGGRTQGLGYTADDVRKQFTGYERDNEINLDYAQARYFNAAHGRFTSVDPVKMSSKRMRNPQGFNLYAYAINNPLKYVDPDGEDNELVTEEREYSFSITKVDTVKGKKVTTQIDFKVKEKYVDIYNDAGEKVNTGIRVHVETSNGANAQNLLSTEKLTVAAQNAAGVIAASWQVGVDKSVALATASKETIMGAASGGPRSDGAVNPMQLTNGQFHPNTVRDANGQIMADTNKSATDRERNIYLSLVLLKQKIDAAGSTEGGYRSFGPPPSQDPNYVSDSLKYNTQIQQSIDRTQKVTQPFVVNPK